MGNFFFGIAYRIYLTDYGRTRHNNALASTREAGIHPHSKYTEAQGAAKFVYGNIRVIPVPFLEDNLAYIVQDTSTGNYVLVDPADHEAI